MGTPRGLPLQFMLVFLRFFLLDAALLIPELGCFPFLQFKQDIPA